ncbi:hypothetical protein ACHAXT_002265 [Thalassiosira profunda]
MAESALQPVLRLIHCVQKERGASCALVGSLPGSVQEGHPYDRNLRAARVASNSAISSFYSSAIWRRYCGENCEGDNNVEIASMLFEVRELVDGGMGDEGEYLFFHDVFIEYNALVSDCLIQLVANELTKRKESIQRKMSSATSTSELSRNAKVALSLLDLIQSFVELKESLGMERATLSGLMANGMTGVNDENSSPEMQKSHHGDRLNLVLNDLVMVVEDQHRIMRDLRKQSGLVDLRGSQSTTYSAPPEVQELLFDEHYAPLLRLVGESIVPPESFRFLQNFIRKDFDIGGFQHATTMEEFWASISLYMDELHSKELLLLEELENTDSSGSFDELDLLSLGRPPSKSVEAVNQMNEDELRSALMSLMAQKERKLPPLPSPKKGKPGHRRTHSQTSSGKPDRRRTNSQSSLFPKSDDRQHLEEWEIDLYEVEFVKRIGRGSAGTTYLGKYCQQEVAIKVAATSELGLDGWTTELTYLKKLHHVNIIRFMGCIQHASPPTYCLVLEYCDGGDLSAALGRRTPPKFFNNVALGVARGVSYLHKMGYMHRDIKPSNVLISGDPWGVYVTKITDFGLAARVHSPSKSGDKKELTAETGTYRYMAPEVIRHEQYNYAADIYSTSMLMWEIITREKPFADKSQIEAAGSVALEGKRPGFPDGTPVAVKSLIEKCWAEKPDERMEIGDVVKSLDELEGNAEANAWLSSPTGYRVYEKPDEHVYDDELDVPAIDITEVQQRKKRISVWRTGLFGKKK